MRLALACLLAIAFGFALGLVIRPERPPTDWAGVLGDPDWLERQRLLLAALDALDAESAAAGAAPFDERGYELTECEIRPYVNAWYRFDPGAVQGAVLSWQTAYRTHEGLKELTKIWALQGDTDGATQFVMRRGESDRRNAAVEGLIAGWAGTGDLEGAGQLVMRMEVDTLGAALEAYVRLLLQEVGPAGAMAWVDGLGEDARPERIRAAFRLVLRFVSISDPLQGKAWYEKWSGDPRADGASQMLASEWAEHDPLAAVEWLLKQPNKTDATNAMRTTMRRWLEEDPSSAMHWLESQLDDPIAREGIRPVVRHLAASDPPEAIDWARRIPDPAASARSMADVIVKWRKSDPEAAEAWLDESRSELPSLTLNLISGPQRSGV